MAFDGLMVKAITQELSTQIINGRIERVLQPDRDEIILQIRKPGETLRLLISFHSELARIHLTTENKNNPVAPPAFCMLLRKHIEGARIIRIEQIGFERIIHLFMETYENINKPTEKLLVFELTGRHSNLVLIEPGNKIVLDAGKRIVHGQSRYRELIPNVPYTPPPAQNKVDPLIIETLNTFKSILDEHPNQELLLDKQLNQTFLNLSKLTIQQIIIKSGLDENKAWKELNHSERQNLWISFQQTISPSHWKGHIILKPDKHAYQDYYPLEPVQFDQNLLIPFSSINKMLDFYFTQLDKQRKLSSQKSKLIKQINQLLKRYNKKIALQENELFQAENSEQWRIKGELLLANLYQLRGREQQIEVINFYEPENSTVLIQLDPRLSGSQNAQKMFKNYAKAKATVRQLNKHLKSNREEAEYLESILFHIDDIADLEELEEIKEELKQQGYLTIRHKQPKIKKSKSIIKPLKYISSDGFSILVGKNNTQNDYLTLRIAKSEDLWLHAKNIPGSHVIIKNEPKGEIPKNTLEQAAVLAAYFSKGKNSNRVPIDYTFKKNVRKPNNAKPGMVIYDNYKTIYVKPEKERVEQIKSISSTQ